MQLLGGACSDLSYRHSRFRSLCMWPILWQFLVRFNVNTGEHSQHRVIKWLSECTAVQVLLVGLLGTLWNHFPSWWLISAIEYRTECRGIWYFLTFCVEVLKKVVLVLVPFIVLFVLISWLLCVKQTSLELILHTLWIHSLITSHLWRWENYLPVFLFLRKRALEWIHKWATFPPSKSKVSALQEFFSWVIFPLIFWIWKNWGKAPEETTDILTRGFPKLVLPLGAVSWLLKLESSYLELKQGLKESIFPVYLLKG